uniref:E5 n=1 Tax=Human papillomavirus type 70 TaxID=39457 RepID=T2A7L6_HPV70|nr:E5 [Human papillomavirus type 70]
MYIVYISMIALVFLVWFAVCLYICCSVPLLPSVHLCAYMWLLLFVFIVVHTTPLQVFCIYLLFFILPMWCLHILSVSA